MKQDVRMEIALAIVPPDDMTEEEALQKVKAAVEKLEKSMGENCDEISVRFKPVFPKYTMDPFGVGEWESAECTVPRLKPIPALL